MDRDELLKLRRHEAERDERMRLQGRKEALEEVLAKFPGLAGRSAVYLWLQAEVEKVK